MHNACTAVDLQHARSHRLPQCARPMALELASPSGLRHKMRHTCFYARKFCTVENTGIQEQCGRQSMEEGCLAL